jgi:uncharacterized protein YjbJ (UPF0337 family)
MDMSRAQAIGHQLKGRVKEGLGRIIGDAKLTADGSAERAAGDAETVGGAGEDSLIGIDNDRIAGVGHQFKGALKEGLGNITNDQELKASGAAERAVGKAQNAIGSAKDEAREALESKPAPIDTVENTKTMINTPERLP